MGWMWRVPAKAQSVCLTSPWLRSDLHVHVIYLPLALAMSLTCIIIMLFCISPTFASLDSCACSQAVGAVGPLASLSQDVVLAERLEWHSVKTSELDLSRIDTHGLKVRTETTACIEYRASVPYKSSTHPSNVSPVTVAIARWN